MGWTIIEQLKIKYQTLFINFYENYIQAMLVFLFDWNACTKSKTLPLRTRNDSILILIMKVWSPAWLMLKQLPPEAVQRPRRDCLVMLSSIQRYGRSWWRIHPKEWSCSNRQGKKGCCSPTQCIQMFQMEFLQSLQICY